METFHWCVAPNMGETASPKVKVIKLGDGYEQRMPDGINNDLRSYSVTLKVRREESQFIDDFLTRHGGYKAFRWREPNRHHFITVKCESWSTTVDHTVTTITVTFQEVVA